jgi:hypothetical protein
VLTPTRIHLHDVIEVELLSDGTHRLVRVVDRAPMRHYSWILSPQFFESDGYRSFTSAVAAAGGQWERILSGVLYAHIPDESAFDAAAELDKWTSNDWPD